MPMPPKDINILVVDDQTLIRNIVKDFLQKMGYLNVFEAANGKQAIEELKKRKFDLVLLDWNMPEVQGIDVLRFIRKELKWDIPVIMITAEAEKEKVIEAAKEGVSDYIVKPFKPATLAEKLEKVWKG